MAYGEAPIISAIDRKKWERFERERKRERMCVCDTPKERARDREAILSWVLDATLWHQNFLQESIKTYINFERSELIWQLVFQFLLNCCSILIFECIDFYIRGNNN